MSKKETAHSRRIKQILKELKPFMKQKVVEAYGAAGPGFVARWSVPIDKPMKIKEVYSLKNVEYMRGFTITLEDGTVIKSRIDTDTPIIIYPPDAEVAEDGFFVKIKEE